MVTRIPDLAYEASAFHDFSFFIVLWSVSGGCRSLATAHKSIVPPAHGRQKNLRFTGDFY
jgi:hypothetical protein